MFSKLFHIDNYMPDNVVGICKDYQKTLSKYFLSHHFQEHLKNQMFEDRSHTYLENIIKECLNSLKTTQQDVFEVELSKSYRTFGEGGWFITKYCLRVPYSNIEDLVVVIRPQYKNARLVDNMVVTAWLNSKSDNHNTLDKSKYCSKNEWILAR